MANSIIKVIEKNSIKYRCLDYIQSTGTQYINLGIIPKTTTRFEIDLQVANGTNGYFLSGSGSGRVASEPRFHFATYQNNIHFGLGTGTGAYTTSPACDYQRHKYKLSAIDGKAYIDSTLIKTFTPLPSSYANVSFKLFATPDGTPDAIGKCWRVDFYEDTLLVAQFIPVERVSDNVLGMLDLVNGTFLTNAGTGTFTKGNYIKVEHIYKPTFIENGVEYEELNYIESTGTQSIKLGNSIPFNTDNVVIECDFQYTQVATDNNAKWLFSNQTSTSNILDFYSQANTELSSRGFFIRPSASQSSQAGIIVPHDTNKHHMKADFINKKFYFDDDVYNMGYSSRSSQTAPMYLFRRANQDTGYAKAKLFNFKYTRVVQHDYDFDLIPAKRVSDGVIGLFNKIDKSFLTNAGSGTFVSGGRIEVQKLTKCLISNNVKYYPLDYLESSGTQYINTLLNLEPSKTIIDTKYEWIAQPSQYDRVFGVMDSSTTQLALTADTTTTQMGTYYAEQGANLGTISLNTPYTLTMKNGQVILNGTSRSVQTKTGTLVNRLILFGLNNNGTITRLSKSKIYYFKITHNGELIMNLIPVKRASDNAKGMLNLIDGTFFGNSGSGTFTGNKREIILVE